MKSVGLCSAGQWEKVCSKVSHAVVFLDNSCAEGLHWHGGLKRLLQAGATDVREFSSFECASASQKKGVFIVSSVLQDVTTEIICDIIQASHFQYVVVVTAASPLLHAYRRTGSLEGDDRSSVLFDRFEEQLLEWMGNMNFTSEVVHVPLFTASLGPSLFVTPVYTRLFPLLDTDVKRIELQYNADKFNKVDRKTFESLHDIEAHHLPNNLRYMFKMFVSGFNGLLQDLEVGEDIYSLGHTSRILATELENFPPAKHRRKNSQHKAAVVFVDRTLDLAVCTGHQSETLLDRITCLLPRLPGHNNDVMVDMSSLCAVQQSAAPTVIVPGCLATQDSSRTQLQTLLTTKQKETVMESNRHLVEAASQENLPLQLSGRPGRVTADTLESTLSLFKGNYAAIQANLDTLQTAMATAQVLKHPGSGHYDRLQGLEKGLIQNIGDEDAPSCLSQICNLLKVELDKPRTERLHTLDDIFCLLLYTFTLAGSNIASTAQEERDFLSLLVQSIMKEKEHLPDFVENLVGETVTESIVMAVLEDAWEKMVAIGTARDHLRQFRKVLEPGSVVSPASYRPLLKQLVETIFDPAKPDLEDVEHKSSGLKDYLKTGLSFFKSVSKPRPNDHPLLIIFVVGGVTSTEVKQIKDVLSIIKPDTQVVVGSTQLVKPADILNMVLCQDNVNMDSG